MQKPANELADAPEGKETEGYMTRRKFLSAGVTAAGTYLLANPIHSAFAAVPAGVNFAELKSKFNFAGRVVLPTDPTFNRALFGELWNQRHPTRHPDVIAQVTNEQDVVAAVKYAIANKLKVAVRGGGHNWAATSLRDGGMMIDLTNLNRVVSMDPVAKKAVLQPIISNREVQEHLNPHGLAFPSGHCPQVKLSGYFLSGGMAWNQGTWGHGCESVEAIEMVTPQGEMITATPTQNQDYYWAALGGGPGFFGVVVRYHVKLYSLPKAITASSYFYPHEDIVEVGKWLGPLQSKMPANVELSLWSVNAPPNLAEKAKSSNGKLTLVTATMFAETADEAKKALAILDTYPKLDTCLSKTIAQPTDFPSLFDASGSLWPINLRCKVDAMFSDAPVADVFASVKDLLVTAPSKTVFMMAMFTGEKLPPLPKTALSMSARLYGGPWTMWEEEADDATCIAWHNNVLEKVMPMISGHYIAESSTDSHPQFIKESYKEANWNKLAELRKKYDPTGVFFDFTQGMT